MPDQPPEQQTLEQLALNVLKQIAADEQEAAVVRVQAAALLLSSAKTEP